MFAYVLQSILIFGLSQLLQYSLSYVHFCYFCHFLRYFCYWTFATICTYDLDLCTPLLRSYVPCNLVLVAPLCPLLPYLALATLYTDFS